jgi:DNA-binding CsgD family transcriptional regulator
VFELTPRQYEIASYMVLDMADEQIAAALALSAEELEREIQAIHGELRTKSRAGIVVALLQNTIRVRTR